MRLINRSKQSPLGRRACDVALAAHHEKFGDYGRQKHVTNHTPAAGPLEKTMSNIIQLTPNKWVSEKVLIAVTGLKPGTITRARKESWMLGREYLHISPDGNPKPSSECIYNREAVDQWIEAQKKNQPGAKTT